MALPNKQRMNLDVLAATLEIPMWRALQANVAMWGALDIFAKDPEHKLFAMNPINTFVHTALRALEDRCVVEIAEALKVENHLIRPGMTIRGKAELVNHRDAVSARRGSSGCSVGRHRGALVFVAQRRRDQLLAAGAARGLTRAHATSELAPRHHDRPTRRSAHGPRERRISGKC